jgi:hypothetical protein
MLQPLDAENDVRTIKSWSSFIGVGCTQLRSVYCRLGIAPHDARDAMRLIRALARANGDVAHVRPALDIGDYRTEAALFAKGGLQLAAAEGVLSPKEFVQQQRLIATNHVLWLEMLLLLASWQ